MILLLPAAIVQVLNPRSRRVIDTLTHAQKMATAAAINTVAILAAHTPFSVPFWGQSSTWK